jgi:mono/diheme cytochrome c family protein
VKAIFWIGGLVALIFALAIAYIGSGAYNVAADIPHWTLTQSVMESVRTRSIARHSAGIEVPALDDPALATSAAGNYDAMCAGCHLKPGIESTEMSLGLYPAAPNLVKRPLENPAAAFWTIKRGIKMTGMPAWGKTIEDPYLWGLVAFLDELPEMSVDRYRELVEASGGHHHGGSETDLDTERPDYDQGEGGESHTHDHAQNLGAHDESKAPPHEH